MSGEGFDQHGGSWAVMCCGCFRFLSKDGGITDWRVPKNQKPSVHEPKASIIRIGDCAGFPDKESADTAALSAGWQTADQAGPGNHRCPDCQKGQSKHVPVRRGAYIYIAQTSARPERSEDGRGSNLKG